jgi:hypothetical protein
MYDSKSKKMENQPFVFVKECYLRSRFTIILLTIFVAACSRSEFGQQHKEAVLQNPPGVELENALEWVRF